MFKHSLFIDVIVPSQKSVWSCIYLLVIAISEHSECVIFVLFLILLGAVPYNWFYNGTEPVHFNR